MSLTLVNIGILRTTPSISGTEFIIPTPSAASSNIFIFFTTPGNDGRNGFGSKPICATPLVLPCLSNALDEPTCAITVPFSFNHDAKSLSCLNLSFSANNIGNTIVPTPTFRSSEIKEDR